MFCRGFVHGSSFCAVLSGMTSVVIISLGRELYLNCLGGQPNHGWQICFPRWVGLYDGSDLKTYLLMRW